MYSDILFGILYIIYIYILKLFLASILAFYLTFCVAFYHLTFFSGILSLRAQAQSTASRARHMRFSDELAQRKQNDELHLH